MRPPKTPPKHLNHLSNLLEQQWPAVRDAKPILPDGRYLPWDELRHRTPPDGLSAEQWWTTIKWARKQASSPVRAMQALYQVPFSFVSVPTIQATLFELDRTNVARDLLMALGNDDIVAEYRVSQLIEEAISSSVIEGARPTTREVARQMVREGRAPTSRDERMIHNNWRAMRRILELRDEQRAMTLDDFLEIHRILGEGALDVPGAEGQLRTTAHSVVVSDMDGTVWHSPPQADGLVERINALLAFANDTSRDQEAFVHPIVRAILVHFWVGFEHPFRDGNGRIARALFYWCMLRHGYEMAEFLSISGPIDRSPTAYYLAFAHTELDEGDLTYFILHQLRVIQDALADLTKHLQRRAENMRELARTIAEFDDLNHRQRALLQHAVRHPLESYTIESHASSHHVHYQTGRNDLVDLVKRGYLSSARSAEGKRFRPTKKLTASASKGS
jgi:Fic family protein